MKKTCGEDCRDLLRWHNSKANSKRQRGLKIEKTQCSEDAANSIAALLMSSGLADPTNYVAHTTTSILSHRNGRRMLGYSVLG